MSAARAVKPGLILGIAVFSIAQFNGWCETIYTKDGRRINAEVIDEFNEDKGYIQYYAKGAETRAINAYRVDILEIKEILNDDGSVSKYSPTYCESCAQKAEDSGENEQ